MKTKIKTWIVIGLGVIFFGWGNLYAALTPIFNNENKIMEVECHGGITPGWTKLKDFTSLSLSDIQSFAVSPIDEHPTTPNTEYSYVVASANTLKGSLYVERYEAKDYEIGDWCYHGAGLVMDYDPVATDPKDLRWVQFYDKSGWIMDGTEDDNPEYWADGDFKPDGSLKDKWTDSFPDNSIQKPDGQIEADRLTFVDYPWQNHLEANAWAGGRGFNAFLTGITHKTVGEINTWNVTLYEGFSWGYDGECTIPAPGAILLGSIGIGLVGYLRRRRTL